MLDLFCAASLSAGRAARTAAAAGAAAKILSLLKLRKNKKLIQSEAHRLPRQI